MNKTIFQGLVAGAIATAGIMTAANGALAQAAPSEATVNFTGTVGSVCLFSNVVNGVLVDDGGNLTSGFPGGGGPIGAMSGAVDVDCTGGVDLSVSLPQDNGSTTDLLANANQYESYLELSQSPFGSANAFFDNGITNTLNTGFLPGPFSDTLDIDMRIEAGPIPEGAYNYNVVVTATPL